MRRIEPAPAPRAVAANRGWHPRHANVTTYPIDTPAPVTDVVRIHFASEF